MLLHWLLIRLAVGLSELRLKCRGGCQKRRSCRPSWAAFAVGSEATRLHGSSAVFSLLNVQGLARPVAGCAEMLSLANLESCLSNLDLVSRKICWTAVWIQYTR